MLKDRIRKDVSKAFEDLKALVYKKLWEENPEKCTIIEDVGNKSIHISKDKISFDGKNYIHRSEEKIIREELGKLEEETVDYIYNEVVSMSEDHFENFKEHTRLRKEGRVEESREDEELDKLIDDFFKLYKQAPPTIQNKVRDYTSVILELKLIDEQLDILREIGGNKEKVLSLLEQKHDLLKQLKKL